jgi:exodeoxyribonuclease VII large subunit
MQQRHIFHISELNRDVRQLLESGFPLIWLQGELSNFVAHGSGHWYFSLKDAKAQISGAMFKMKNRLVRFTPKSGMEVLVRAKITLYEPQGRFQIVVEHMEEAGAGALQRAYDELKAKLQSEGLFNSDTKQALPSLPTQIGVITSPSGAAVRDIISTLQRRFPALPVMIYPVQVQGELAAKQIASAIALANNRQECDVILLARGGGSMEDLWPFNEEIVARAIAASKIPIVSGVGHEVDFTIADFVADHRAATPTAAAELVSPDQAYLSNRLNEAETNLQRHISQQLARQQERLQWLSQRLQSPTRRLQDQAQRLDELEQRLLRSQQQLQDKQTHRLSQLQGRLLQHSPAQALKNQGQRADQLQQRLQQAMQQRLKQRQQQLAEVSRTLNAVSPLATLDRGYAISFADDNKTVLTDSKQLKSGDQIHTRLAKGGFSATVTEIQHD